MPTADAVSMTDQPAIPPIPDDEVRERLARARTTFAALRPRVVAGEPWPLADDFGAGPEASWGAREVLSHTAEMLPYWLGEMERVVDLLHPRRSQQLGAEADQGIAQPQEVSHQARP